MTSQSRSLTGRICRAYRAFFEPLNRRILPLSSDVNILPTQLTYITGRVGSEGFLPGRLTISGAGTNGGAADWIVNDIKISGKSQFVKSGDIPGDMFAAKAALEKFVTFGVARACTDVVIIVTYIGTNDKGCKFHAAIDGVEYDPGMLDMVRDAISQAFASVSRGLSTRPH